LIPSLALPSAAALPIEVWDAEFLPPDADGGDMGRVKSETNSNWENEEIGERNEEGATVGDGPKPRPLKPSFGRDRPQIRQ